MRVLAKVKNKLYYKNIYFIKYLGSCINDTLDINLLQLRSYLLLQRLPTYY